MNEKSKPYCVSRGRSGLTLVEVVAGLLLMSTLLVGILTTCGRHTRQIKRARQQMAAAALADRLLTEWARDPEQRFTENGCDPSDESGLSWRWRTVESGNVPETMGIEIVRLEILSAKFHEEEKPLVAVEIVRPLQQIDSATENSPPSTGAAHATDRGAPSHDAR